MELQLIQNRICEFRGMRVMLDRDLAALYGVETRALIQATKRNLERFPQEFMFQLSPLEFENWKSQIVMSNEIKMGLRRPPYVFTEQGVAILSAVLKSDAAIKVSIQIMNAFVAMRQFLINNSFKIKEIEELKVRVKLLEAYSEETLKAVNDLSEDSRKEFDDIYIALSELANNNRTKKENRPKVGFV